MPTAAAITYQQFLRGVTDGAMSVVERVSQHALKANGDPRLVDAPRSFCWLSSIVRRSILISQYLDTVPTPAEESHGKLLAALDWVLPFFAQHKVDLASYARTVDAELVGPDNEAEDLLDMEDVSGRRPLVLVAELCRDFGMALHGLPPEWPTGVPDEVRLYCARAALAGVEFDAKPRGVGHLMER